MAAPKLYLALLFATLCATACYDTTSLRMTVQSPHTTLDCAAVADQVFIAAAFERSNAMSGPNLFYSPRTSPTALVGLHWGIGVWLKGNEKGQEGDGCHFELEALGAEPGCGMQCPYSSQRGAEFDQTLKDMAGRLSAAFEQTHPPQ